MVDVVKVSSTLQEDDWISAYVEGFTRHSVGLRRAGLLERLPAELTQKGVVVFDEHGKPWGNLRGEDSVVALVAEYMEEQGGDQSIVAHWMERQKDTTWAPTPQAYKYYLAESRGGRWDQYFWGPDGIQVARDSYQREIRRHGRERFEASYQAWHAFNYELLRNVRFPRNNQAGQYVEIMRTETKGAIKRSGLEPGQMGQFSRAANVSGSVFKPVVIWGDHMVLQQVPYQRITGIYFYERFPGANICAFANDSQNEFVFVPDGLESYYVGGPSHWSGGHQNIWQHWPK